MPPHGNAATTAAGHIGPALHITHFNSFPASRLFVYRVNIPCLSLWERWPSAARTERVDTLRKYAGVGTLRKHAGGMFLVPISAAMPS